MPQGANYTGRICGLAAPRPVRPARRPHQPTVTGAVVHTRCAHRLRWATCTDAFSPQIPHCLLRLPTYTRGDHRWNSTSSSPCGTHPGMAGFRTPAATWSTRSPRTRRTPNREVPRRPRRARGCRCLGSAQPAGPSQRARPGRPAGGGEPRGARALDLRLRDLRTRDSPGRGRRRGPRPGQRPAARRHLPQPPGQAGGDGDRRHPGVTDVRLGAVQPADHAGRGLPDAA